VRFAGVLGLVGGILAIGSLGWPATAVPAWQGLGRSDAVSPLARQSVAHVAHARCSAGSIRAIVRGRVTCLSAGGHCRARNRRAYRRYGFICRDEQLVYDWARLVRRPLHIPTLTPGSACPATQPSGTLGERGSDASQAPAFGPGPAYVTLGAETSGAMLTFVWPPTEAPYRGWYGTKALWTIPRYTGAVLVRGRQLDGDSGLGFDRGPGWSNRVHRGLRLGGPEVGLHPAATFVRGPGCFAYQVDVLHASYLIVFRAELH
jgi:hypothetical protein